MTYDEIMEEIKSGLTGEAKADMKYLMTQIEKYREHELAQEIIRACGRMIASIMPEDAKEEFNNLIRKEELNIDSALDEMHFAIYKKDYQRALNIIEALVQKADDNLMFKEDTVSAYFDFFEFFEEVIYIQVNQPKKDIRRTEFPFASIYLNHGSLLVELGRFEEANNTLKKALKWNPVNMGIRNEYMETLKRLGRLEEYFEMAVESFKYAFRSKDIGRCYRNLGWYFVEKKMYQEAIGVYIMSIQYDKDSNAAQSELYYIQQMDSSAKEPTMDELNVIAEKCGFRIGLNKTVLQTAYGYGIQFMEKKMIDAARYCFGILYELTEDEEIKKLLEKLSD